MLRQAQAVNQVMRESPHHAAAMTTRYLQEQSTPESEHKSLQPRQWYSYWNCIHRYGDKHHLHRWWEMLNRVLKTNKRRHPTTFCTTITSSSSCINTQGFFLCILPCILWPMFQELWILGLLTHPCIQSAKKESELTKFKTFAAVENAPKWTLFQF